MGELHTGPYHPLCGADPESYFDLHLVPPGYRRKGEGNCMYLAQCNHAYSGWVELVGLGRLPIWESRTLIINPRVGETRYPWLAIHLGERNSEFKPIVRGICWDCPILLGHGSLISCYFPCRVAKFWLLGCGVPAFPSWFSTTFAKIVTATGL